MVTKPTGRRRGRPRLPLRNDPERYWVARFLAECELKRPGITDRKIALAMTAVRYGEAVDDFENVKNLTTASGPVDFKYVKDSIRGREDSKEPRNRSAFHRRADDLLRKARRLWSSHDQGDCKWLVAMREAWVRTLSGSPEKFALQAASSLCLVAGEIPFFYRALQPIIHFRFHGGPVPGFSAPDFIPHSAAWHLEHSRDTRN
jgi:hypothetical protein